MEELEEVQQQASAYGAPVIVRPSSGLHLNHFKSVSGEKGPEKSESLLLEYSRILGKRRRMLLCFAIGGASAWMGWRRSAYNLFIAHERRSTFRT